MTVADVRDALAAAQRPVLILGHGIRLAGAVGLIDPLLARLGIPALTSWAALDTTAHPLVYGHCGLYGGKTANHIVQQADLVLAIGTRLAIPQVGYDIDAFAPGARIIVVDIDPEEASKYARFEPVVMDAGDFIRELMSLPSEAWPGNDWARIQPDPKPPTPAGYLCPYTFIQRLQPFFRDDQVIVTDSGTALICAHQVLHLRPPQRLLTTTGLGEMGFGLPGAVGASFARNKGEVLCLNTDGGMMFNLQELQTIAHHRLPIKILVFSNDGYAMIRRTQDTLGHVRSGVDAATGVSMPDFQRVGRAFGLCVDRIVTWDDFDAVIPAVMRGNSPALIDVCISPNQEYLKVPTIKRADGSLYTPPLDADVVPA